MPLKPVGPGNPAGPGGPGDPCNKEHVEMLCLQEKLFCCLCTGVDENDILDGRAFHGSLTLVSRSLPETKHTEVKKTPA